MAKIMVELYKYTDLFERAIEEDEYIVGGGEYIDTASFCRFSTSGVHTIRRNGRIFGYFAHPVMGGWDYCGDDEAFIVYDDGCVSLYDYPDEDCIWDDDQVAETLQAISDTKRTWGLSCINYLDCKMLRLLRIPESCELIESEALLSCEALEKLIVPNRKTEIGENAVSKTVRIIAPLGSLAQQYCEKYGNQFTDYNEYCYQLTDHKEDCNSLQEEYEISDNTNMGDDEVIHYCCLITEDCEYINEDDDFSQMIFASSTVKIEENSLIRASVMHGFSGSTAEQYAKQHGIPFHLIDSTEFDPDALPQNISIKDGMLCAKGSVCLRLNGLTDKQLAELPVGETLELVPEPDTMTNLRLVFRSKETGETRGMMTYRAGYTAAYLMQKGYLRWEDIVTEENGYVMATVLWQEPLTDQTKQQLRFYQKILSCYPWSRKRIEEEPCFASFFTPVFQIAAMDSEPGSQTAVPNKIAELFEPGNRLSFFSMRCIHSISAALSTLHYNDQDRYGIVGSPFALSVDASKKITCYVNGTQTELTPDEEAYARIYIDQYRKIYNLPLLFTDGGEQNGTVYARRGTGGDRQKGALLPCQN